MNFVTRHFVGENGFDWKKSAKTVLRLAPWTVGPVTGLLAERAIRCSERGERVLAGMYVVLNIAFLLALPMLTASIAARI